MIYSFCALLGFHYLGDFAAQPRFIADRKYKELSILGYHAAVYWFVLFFGTYGTSLLLKSPFEKEGLLLAAIINGLSHFLIDFVTSRMTAYFFKKGQMYQMFCVIGFDQWMHVAILLVTYSCILQGE